MFELGKDLFDWIEVGAVWRQEQKARAFCPDSGPDSRLLVTGEIVEDDDIAGAERRAELFLDPLGEASAIDRLIEDERGVDPVTAQGGDEEPAPDLIRGHRFPMAIRHFGVEPLANRCPAPQRGHVRFGPSFINKDEASGIRPVLELLPLLAPSGHLGPQLFGGEHFFF